MATTPEEPVEGLTEKSPSVFLDVFWSKPDGRSKGFHHVPGDIVLPYIARFLMEDDIDDKPNDHPAVLQVQQPFAQILSSKSFVSNHSETEGGNDLLQDAVGAFLKGMKEANVLLPAHSQWRRKGQRRS
jgi:hypothetical protein